MQSRETIPYLAQRWVRTQHTGLRRIWRLKDPTHQLHALLLRPFCICPLLYPIREILVQVVKTISLHCDVWDNAPLLSTILFASYDSI